MRLLIDIGHPAHVHYFKNLIKIMKNKGHNFLVISRNKEIAQYLLNKYEIPYYSRGKGSKNLIGKLGYMVKADYLIFRQALSFKPDLFLSAGSIYPAHASFLLRKPHISFEDTEHSTGQYKLYSPFTEVVLTPSTFTRYLGNKQIRFNGYLELCYLHPNYFTPDASILNILGVEKAEKYIIMRFVSWDASHDIGHSGLSLKMKRESVKELSKYARVFISSEGELPEDLKPYRINIPPEAMHDALAYATLLYGESATMASECAVLGTPPIYLDNEGRGYTDEEEKRYGLVFNFNESMEDQKLSVRKAVELLKSPDIKKRWRGKREKMISEKIDVTAFMVWFVENYPESVRIMKKDPDYQLRFK